MQNEEQDRALQAPVEGNPDKDINTAEEEPGNFEENIKSNRKYDPVSGNDNVANEMIEKEKQIDPGNEHHHSTGN